MFLASMNDSYIRRKFVPQGFGAGLGMIPSWIFSGDPGINISLNPDVKFPSGWDQKTVQPYDGCQTHPDLAGVFDSWAWTNRKWLVIGGVGLIGAALLAGAGALLR